MRKNDKIWEKNKQKMNIRFYFFHFFHNFFQIGRMQGLLTDNLFYVALAERTNLTPRHFFTLEQIVANYLNKGT